MKKTLLKAAPMVLTIAGMVGVIATSVASAKLTPKYIYAISEAEEAKQEEVSKAESIKIGIRTYAPSILIGAATATCILGAHVFNKKQQASLASAYMLLDQAYKGYRKEVINIHGKDADRDICCEVAKKNYKDNTIKKSEDRQLFYDSFSGRYFESTEAYVIGAEYHFNRNFILRGYACLNEFYDFLGQEHVPGGDEHGWSFDNGIDDGYEWIDFTHTKVELEDGLECYIITMDFEPRIMFDDCDI